MSNELHVPTMGRIRDDYIEAWAGHFMDGEKGAAEYFDQAMGRLLTQVRDAAEQRGADKAIAVFEEMSDDMGEAIAFDVLTTPHGEAEYPVSHFREKLQEAINDATDQTRADQEGDDEKH